MLSFNDCLRIMITKYCAFILRIYMLVIWLPACISDRLHNAKPGECMWDPSLNKGFVVIIATLGYHGPCVVMLFCYFKVFIFMRKRGRILAAEGGARIQKVDVSVIQTDNKSTSGVFTQKGHTSSTQIYTSLPLSQQADPLQSVLMSVEQQSATSSRHPDREIDEPVPNVVRRQKRDRGVFVTLTYVVVGYAVTWIPFHFVWDVSSVCPSCISRDGYELVFWTSYCNSTINPFLYYISTPEFRRAFKKLLCRK